MRSFVRHIESASSVLARNNTGHKRVRQNNSFLSSSRALSSSHVNITTTHYTPESSFYDTEHATTLVDSLLAHTQSLMQQPYSDSGNSMASHHFIAFSGGVDSSLTAALVHRVSKDADSSVSDLQVRAVLGISPAVPAEQRELASRVAQQIGIPLQHVFTEEGTDPTYIANEGQACLACKTHLYSTLQAIYASVADNSKVSSELEERSHCILYNGTNADDVQDPTRVGLIAAQQFHVVSPLRHIRKDQVRLAARHLGLLNWNYAASPCLRSRLALGVPATRDHLERIEQAERFVRQQLTENMGAVFDETSNLRVRLLAQNRVCIELDAGSVLEYAQEQVDSWNDFLQTKLQFAAVQVRAFRSGSVAATIK